MQKKNTKKQNIEIIKNADIKSFNTMRLRCTAKYFAEINSVSQLKDILSDKNYQNEKMLVLGNGSNILLPEYYDGVVLKINIKGKKIIFEDDNYVILEAGAGEDWNELVEYTVSKEWGGIENMIMIPGTAGAAPVQNISGYGQSLNESFLSLDAISIKDGKLRTFSAEECKLGYRDSIFKQELKNKYIIISIQLKLSKNLTINTVYDSIKGELSINAKKPCSIKDVCEVIKKIRAGKLPDPAKIGTAGSFFKNPIISREKLGKLQKDFPDLYFYNSNGDSGAVVVSAAWLIETAGLADKRIGDCGVWEKQPLNIVNYGNATPDEIMELMNLIKNAIDKKYGIELENEVEIV